MSVSGAKLVRVMWRDSSTSHGWEATSESSVDGRMVTSVGYFIHEDDVWLVLAADIADYGDETQNNRRIEIPRVAIASNVEIDQ